MAEMYYILSKDTGNGPYLMGSMSRLCKGEYKFSYMINRDTFPEWFMKIPGMDNIDKVYETDDVKNCIIHRVTPHEGTLLCVELMKHFNFSKYDEWDILVAQIEYYDSVRCDKYPLSDSHQIVYFYKALPGKVNRYDE